MKKSKLKAFLENRKTLTTNIFKMYNHLPFNNKYQIKKNNKFINNGMMKNSKIIVKGVNNYIEIKFMCRLVNTVIEIYGDNNEIIIDENTLIINGDLYVEDNNGRILIGKNTSICGRTHLACIEGKSITIGENCLLSSDITMRTGDSHSILESESRKRINPSKDITIDNHVWIGNQVIILKGVHVNTDCIVGTGSIVTKTYNIKNAIIAGNPAKIIKENINWCGERLEIE